MRLFFIIITLLIGFNSNSFGKDYENTTKFNASVGDLRYFFDKESKKAVVIGLDDPTTKYLSISGGDITFEGITYQVDSIGDGAFDETNLVEVSFGSGIRSIGKRAFEDCPNLRTILMESIKIIDEYAFARCPKLQNFDFSDIMFVGPFAFYKCKSLTEVFFPVGVVWIGESAFQECENLTNVVMYKAVQAIYKNAFKNCKSLTDIVLPDNLKEISEGVFWGCVKLKELFIPIGVTTISNDAFNGCKSLSSLSFPHTIKELGSGIIRGCSNLKELNCSMNPPTEVKGDTFNSENYRNTELIVLSEALEKYKSAKYWSMFYKISTLTPTPSAVKNIPKNIEIDEMYSVGGIRNGNSNIKILKKSDGTTIKYIKK